MVHGEIKITFPRIKIDSDRIGKENMAGDAEAKLQQKENLYWSARNRETEKASRKPKLWKSSELYYYEEILKSSKGKFDKGKLHEYFTINGFFLFNRFFGRGTRSTR